MRRKELEVMHNERKALREALAQYADPANWTLKDGKWIPTEVIEPNIARKALEMDLLDANNYGKAKKASEATKPGKDQWKKTD